MKKLTLILIACLALSAAAQGTASDSIALRAQDAITKFAAAGTLRYATLGIMLCDLRTGQIIASHNPDLACITASTMKTVTASAALQLLGWQFRFRTPVMAVGELTGDHLRGDIVVMGTGDPTLGSKHFPDNPGIVDEIVTALKQRGIRKIDGKIRISEGDFPYPDFDPNWEVEDLAWTYGAGVHGLNFADNRVGVSFTANGGQVSDVTFNPPVPGLKVINKLTSDNADNVEVLLESAAQAYVLTGSASNMKYDFTLTNPSPGTMLADSLARALAAADIELRGHENAVKPDYELMRTQLVEHLSPMLFEIIRSLLDRSDNMFTEALLRAIASSQSRKPTTANGVAIIRELWRNLGLETAPLFQRDGSGLARTNMASVRFFADMLSFMSRQRYGGMALSDLMPTAGSRIGATMAASPMKDRIVLKSGSMRHVQTFVGYYPADRPQYAWAILVNNFNGTRASLKDRMGALLISILPND
mgnify:CR=1 FL=1